MEHVVNILEDSKKVCPISSTEFEGVRYNNYLPVTVTVEIIEDEYQTKVYQIFRSSGFGKAHHMITCEVRDKYDFHISSRSTLYEGDAKFEKAIKRIQRKHNKFIKSIK